MFVRYNEQGTSLNQNIKSKAFRSFFNKYKSDKFAKNVLKPLILTLKFFGIDFENELNGKPKSVNFKIVFVVFGLHLCVVHTLANSIVFAYKERKISHVFPNVGGLLRALSSAIAVDLILYNKVAYANIMADLCKFERHGLYYLNDFENRFKRWCRVVVGAFWIFFILKVFLPLAFITGMDVKGSIEAFMYDIEFLHNMSLTKQRIFWCLEIIAYETFSGFRFLIQLALICFVKLLSCRISSLIDKTNRVDYDLNQIRELCEEHSHIFQLVREIDNRFGFIIFIWLMEWVTTIVFNLPGTLTSIATGGNNWFLLVTLSLESITTLAESFIVSLAIASVGSGQESLMQVAHLKIGKNRGALESEFLSTFMLTKFGCANLYITMFRCVSVTKTFILNVYSVAATYAAFIGQELQKDTF